MTIDYFSAKRRLAPEQQTAVLATNELRRGGDDITHHIAPPTDLAVAVSPCALGTHVSVSAAV